MQICESLGAKNRAMLVLEIESSICNTCTHPGLRLGYISHRLRYIRYVETFTHPSAGKTIFNLNQSERQTDRQD